MNYKKYFSQKIKNVKESKTVAISNLANKLKQQGKEVISLSIGEPDFNTPEEIIESAKKALEDNATNYTASNGAPQLREKISEKFRKDNNLDYDTDQIVVTNGAKHALYQTLQVLLDEGDNILIPEPFWVSYSQMVNSLGTKSKILSTNLDKDFKISPKQIKNKSNENTKALILNTPSNPTGLVYSREEIKDIAEECVKQDIILISDEVYEKFVYDDADHLSPASLGTKIYNHTITINSFSKTYAMTGLRCGYLAAPKAISDQLTKLQGHTTTHACSVSQQGAIAALSLNEEFIESKVQSFLKRRDYLTNRLKQIDGIRLSKPKGAFYAFPNVSERYDMDDSVKNKSLTFCKNLIEQEGLALVPGSAFGRDDCVRISFAAPIEVLEQGMNKLEKFLN
jgi:aspartate aminotransferase